MSFISDWTTIESYLEPIMPLLHDVEVTNIMANPDGKIFYEKRGHKYRAEGVEFSDVDKSVCLQNLARMAGQDINDGNPSLTVRMPDGGRLAGVSPRVVRGGHKITIRRFPKDPFTLSQLEEFNSFPHEVGTLLRNELRNASNLMIVGGTNSGKTTLLNALCSELPDYLRLEVIEDISELNITKPDVSCWQALEGTDSPFTIRDCLKQVLRHNPNRIIMGEMRGGEAYDFLQALNSGHSGCMSTIHARSAELALMRLSHLVLQANTGLPYVAIQQSISAALDTVVFQTYDEVTGSREIDHIIRVDGYDENKHSFLTTDLYRRTSFHRLKVASSSHHVSQPVPDRQMAANA